MVKKFWIIIFCAISLYSSICANETIRATENVLHRLFGIDIPAVQCEVIPAVNGLDVFETECKNGQLVVRGSSTIALCRGFYDYLRANHLGMVGWEGPRVNIPPKWPDAPFTRVKTPFKMRHAYNAVTAGYTFPYWTWERWEQELDWLAMHGYNMIMAPVATEAIAIRVWKEMGFTQSEIDSFYVGPAHLPWLRMGCIKSVGGTLPADWHRDQIALQHKILARMRELGIEPVVQGFAGFVPDAIERLHPEVKSMRTLWNSGFPMHQRPKLILPDEPLFRQISQAYIQEWRREFGDARYYLVDSFNELRNLEASVELFREMGRKTYEAVRAGDPRGIWVIQGWMFSYQRDIWTPENVQALFSSVPSEDVLILDYANDYNSGWDHFEGFYGKSWLMGYVPNMGGKTAYTGKMHFYAEAVANMLGSPLSVGNAGFTLSGKGLENNQVLYELISETAWSGKKIKLDTWLENYSRTRYGNGYPEEMKSAWDLYRQSCYGTFTPHPTFGWQNMRCAHGSVNSDPAFIRGVQSFLACRNDFKQSPSYRDDALEMAAIALSLKADEWFVAAKACLDSGDISAMDKAGARALQMLLDIDCLMESHSLNRLDCWLSLARQHEGDEITKDFYEHNARHIITIWGPPVNDYSARIWSGLIRDFYQPRMKAYLGSLKGEPFDRHKWEKAWVQSTGISRIEPFDNPVEIAAKLVAEAYSEKMITPAASGK
ncbi:alpha-N-acetylglucosaminidase [candidate division KSB1 bacterium]|nr:alpha-N-acetylglucosaminidase [candidate division KSB1 bacterium]